MLTLADVTKAYGARTLFSDVSFQVQREERLGLVGPNGAGKSTLFGLILGEESPDSGEISKERGSTVGFLPQESAPAGEETILDLATAITPEFAAVRDKLRAFEQQHVEHDSQWDDLHAEFESYNGYDIEPRAKKILSGLGFRTIDFDRPARTFSGGWVMRAHLARLLTLEPDLLMLDEPTNHLDLESLIWFQEYLTRYPGAILLISHDRAFLNALCTGILELRSSRVERYRGNYDAYLSQRDARREQQAAAYKNQQREIAHMQSFIDRFGAKASMASRAKSREKQIAQKMQNAVEEPEDDAPTIKFRFPQPPRSGIKVITLTDIHQAYGEHVVYDGMDFAAERGQRVVLVGPNGAGKSTLLKILAGAIPFQKGTRELGHNVQSGYFAQYRLDTLNPKMTVLEDATTVRELNPTLTEQQVRTVLGSFLFRKDDVFKKVSVLSGGEKSRLALVKLLLAPPNLLLMDEPTTHLDIPSIDALVEALKQFEGTLLFISHDVYFIRALANNVLHVNAGKLTFYHGDYKYYLDKSRSSNEREALTSGGGFTDARPKSPVVEKPKILAQSGPKSKDQKRAEAEARNAKSKGKKDQQSEVSELERLISQAEAEQKRLTAELENPATYNAPGAAQRVNRELADVTRRLQEYTRRWEEATEAAE